MNITPAPVIISDDSGDETAGRSAGSSHAEWVNPPHPPGASSSVGWKVLETRKIIRTKKKKRFSSETSEFSFDDLPNICLDDLASVDIGGAALDWLTELDDVRAKSGNLQGRLSGQMKIFSK